MLSLISSLSYSLHKDMSEIFIQNFQCHGFIRLLVFALSGDFKLWSAFCCIFQEILTFALKNYVLFYCYWELNFCDSMQDHFQQEI